jgi:hypothetical protein
MPREMSIMIFCSITDTILNVYCTKFDGKKKNNSLAKHSNDNFHKTQTKYQCQNIQHSFWILFHMTSFLIYCRHTQKCSNSMERTSSSVSWQGGDAAKYSIWRRIHQLTISDKNNCITELVCSLYCHTSYIQSHKFPCYITHFLFIFCYSFQSPQGQFCSANNFAPCTNWPTFKPSGR